jgi:hypothetical protein
MKSIPLSVKDRLEIPIILPEKGGFVQQELAESIRGKIKFTPDEIKKYEMKDLEDGRVIWKEEKVKNKPVEFEDNEIELLKKSVDILDKAENIPTSLFALCKRIRKEF